MDARYPRRSYGWTGVGLLFALYALSFLDRSVQNLLAAPVSKAFDVDDVQMSLLLGAAFSGFYGLVGLPLARVADRSNRRNLNVAGGLLWGASTVLCGFAGSFWLLVIFRVRLALGEAALSPAAYSLVADWFPPKARALPSTVYTWAGGGRYQCRDDGVGVARGVRRRASWPQSTAPSQQGSTLAADLLRGWPTDAVDHGTLRADGG